MSKTRLQRGERSIPRHRRRKIPGLTLVELLCAIIVFVIAGVAVLGAYQSSFRLVEASQTNTIAMNDLRDMTERIKDTAFSVLTTNFPNGTANGPAANLYSTIVGGYTLSQESITVTYPVLGVDPLELIVQVTWVVGGRSYTRSLSVKRTSSV